MRNAATCSRRRFLAAAGAAAGASAALASATRALAQGRVAGEWVAGGAGGAERPVVISSGNGLRTVARAHEMIRAAADPLDAVVEGVRIVEDDPTDNSVGLGGLPNEEGVVELDASVMHGPTHRAGAVAALRNIKNPAAVAREVARRTDHVLIVGEGALRFALRMGFKEENLLTEESRAAWLRWRATLNREDDWLAEDEFDLPSAAGRPGAGLAVPYTTGTIHCSAVTPAGDLAGVTTTSGLSWKLPGRVGDSPIIGAGLYTDNAVGSAGATGRGEAVIQVCGSHSVVLRMEAGDDPTKACLSVLKKIVDCTRAKRLLDASGKPAFNVSLYALRKDGAFGSAAIWQGATFTVCDGAGARVEKCAYLYEKKNEGE
jgi:N4-(beta-N-acetylglucosaminyl)-L-asparaginase